MANAFQVTDVEGENKLIITARVKGVEAIPAEPAEPPVEAADAVEDDPGEAPSATNPVGRPPKKGHPRIEAKAGKPGKPEGALIHTEDGDVEVAVSVRHLLNLINS